MADNYERFVAAYLRLNGYFTTPNFIVHAGDDPGRVSAGHVGNYTETDIIGVRLPHSREVTGRLHIANHPRLVDGAPGRFDAVIAEVKSGKDTTPNRVWRSASTSQDISPAISYIVRFIGLHKETEVDDVARSLGQTFRHEDDCRRLRYIVFAEAANRHYQDLGVSYITFEEAIRFVVEIRGECWLTENIGVASLHHQWDDLLVRVFELANDFDRSVQDRVRDIRSLLDS